MNAATWRGGIIGLVALGLSSGTALAANQMDLLLTKLVEKGILTGAEAGQIRQEVVAQSQEAARAPSSGEALPAAPKTWAWNGDLLLRHEFRNRTGTGQDSTRERLRFRVGLDAKVAEDLKVGARLATGTTTGPTSTMQTLNTSFNKVNFLLDRAYVAYTPAVPGLTETLLTGGIIENPFWTVGQLVWDEDLNFDGAAVRASRQLGPVKLFANGGLFALQTDVTETAALWSLQGGVSFQPWADAPDEIRRHLKITAALAYHDYQNVTRGKSTATALAAAGGTLGNSVDLQDANLLNPTVQLATQVAGVPVATFADVVHNTAAVPGQNNGFQLGLTLGQAQVPWDFKRGWQAGYYFERLEPDATLGAFTYSDFGGGGTNHRGNVWWFKLATLKRSTLGFKYCTTQQVKGAKNHFDTAQVDWVTSF